MISLVSLLLFLLVIIGLIIFFSLSKKSDPITLDEQVSNSQPKENNSIITFFKGKVISGWMQKILWVVGIWLVLVWFFDLPFNPKTALKEELPKRMSNYAITKAKNERVITFAPGETKKIIELSPDEWSVWIKTPPETTWRCSAPGNKEIKFWDGTHMYDSPKQVRYLGIKRGIFRLKGNGKATVTIEYK